MDELGNAPVVAAEDQDTQHILSEVWRVYGHLTAMQVSNLSHQEHGPWDLANKGNQFQSKSWPIQNETIRDHYKSLLEKRKG